MQMLPVDPHYSVISFLIRIPFLYPLRMNRRHTIQYLNSNITLDVHEPSAKRNLEVGSAASAILGHDVFSHSNFYLNLLLIVVIP